MATKKIQLVLDEDAQAALEALVKATHAESMAHVLRDALGVYNSLYELLSANGTAQLALVDKTRHELQELQIPSLRSTHIVAGAKTSIGEP
jgi:hypothetical protein